MPSLSSSPWSLSRLARTLVAAAFVCAALAPRFARAAEDADGVAEAGVDPGAALRVYVLTMGPGDHPFFKFGHNAIAIEDRERAVVYNFGTFNFDAPNLIPKFLRGRLKYWLSRGSLSNTLLDYQDANRSIYAQELDLSSAQKAQIKRNLEENLRPENREYLYDYFWDNCSTRVRDAVDRAVGGRVAAAGAAPASLTFRDHALRMTSDFFWVYLGLDVGLGAFTDQPIDRFREAFLPQKLRELLRDVRIPVEGGADKPLVKDERVVFEARRAALPERPPEWALGFGLVGAAAGGALFLLGRAGRARRAARVAFGTATGLVGLVFGLLGVILLGLWLFTNHRAAHANENILQSPPWALALVVFSIEIARGRQGAISRAFWVAAAAAVAAGIGVLVKPLPWFAQDNDAVAALLVPLWVGVAAGLHQMRQRASAAISVGVNARE